MAEIKYLSLAGLTKYDELIKNYVDGKDSAMDTRVDALEATVGDSSNGLVKAVADNTAALVILNGTGEGSVAKTVSDEVAKVVDSAPKAFDTLKEIANWILKEEGKDGFDAANRISALETTVGGAESGLVKDVADLKAAVGEGSSLDTRIDALEAFKTTATGSIAEAKKAGDDAAAAVATLAAGAVADNTQAISDEVTRATEAESEISDRVTALERGDNSVASQITAAIGALDADAKNTAANAGTAASTLILVEVTEVDGKLSTVVVNAPAFDLSGAAANVLGTSSDTKDSNTVYGAKAYADSLVKGMQDDHVAITNEEISALFAAKA